MRRYDDPISPDADPPTIRPGVDGGVTGPRGGEVTPLEPPEDPGLPPDGPGLPPGPPPPSPTDQDVTEMPTDEVGDIPPPPIPPSPTGPPALPPFTRPGTPAARPFRTPAYGNPSRGTRFGPGVPVTGGDPSAALGMPPEDLGELLRRLSANMGGTQ